MAELEKNILVVDDQRGIRRLLEEVLSSAGYAVDVAGNGLEALEKVRTACPSLIFMDMKMPGLDGIGALRELKELGLSGRVVMMTAYGELDMVEQAKALGAYDFITKPFDIVVIGRMADDYFAQSAAAR